MPVLLLLFASILPQQLPPIPSETLDAVRAEAKSAEQKAAVERLVRAYHEIARPEANADVDPRPILRELHEALRDLGDAFPKDLELQIVVARQVLNLSAFPEIGDPASLRDEARRRAQQVVRNEPEHVKALAVIASSLSFDDDPLPALRAWQRCAAADKTQESHCAASYALSVATFRRRMCEPPDVARGFAAYAIDDRGDTLLDIDGVNGVRFGHEPTLTSADVARITLDDDVNQRACTVDLKVDGRARLATATRRLSEMWRREQRTGTADARSRARMALTLDGAVLLAAVVREPIASGRLRIDGVGCAKLCIKTTSPPLPAELVEPPAAPPVPAPAPASPSSQGSGRGR